MNCYFLANILMGTIYLFEGKFSYIVLNKAVYEKVVEMSTKRRKCRNNPDVFCYICGEYMMTKCRFNVRDFTKRAYKPYFGMKLGGLRQVLGKIGVILILSLRDHPYHIALKFQFQFSLPFLTLLQVKCH